MPRDGTINGIGLDEVNCIDCTPAELKDIINVSDGLIAKYTEFSQTAKAALESGLGPGSRPGSQYKAAEDVEVDE